MLKQKALIGTIVDTHTVVLSAEFFAHFSDALGHAKESTPRVWRFALATLGAHGKACELLELKPKQVLQSRESFLVTTEPKIGDELEIVTTLKDLYEQQAGNAPMGFAEVEVSGTRGKNPIFSSQRIFAIRGGFIRR